MRLVKSVQKMSEGHKCAKTTIFDNFGEIVTLATADAPDPKLLWSGKFNCKTREACEKCAHIL